MFEWNIPFENLPETSAAWKPTALIIDLNTILPSRPVRTNAALLRIDRLRIHRAFHICDCRIYHSSQYLDSSGAF